MGLEFRQVCDLKNITLRVLGIIFAWTMAACGGIWLWHLVESDDIAWFALWFVLGMIPLVGCAIACTMFMLVGPCTKTKVVYVETPDTSCEPCEPRETLVEVTPLLK